VVSSFLKRLSRGQSPIIFGDGSASRDFTPVANVVHAMLRAGDTRREFQGESINVGCGTRTTIGELASALARLLDRTDLLPIHEPARPGDVPHSVADLTLARARLGYEPAKGFDEALAETAAWFVRSLPATV